MLSREGGAKTKELKAQLPYELHVKLHSLKLLTGKNISATVTEALVAYFATRIPSQEERRAVAALAEIHGVPELL